MFCCMIFLIYKFKEDNNNYNNAKQYYYNILKCIKEEKYNTIEELSNEANILIKNNDLTLINQIYFEYIWFFLIFVVFN